MTSVTLGNNISAAEVTHISKHGLWLLLGNEELFCTILSEFPGSGMRQLARFSMSNGLIQTTSTGWLWILIYQWNPSAIRLPSFRSTGCFGGRGIAGFLSAPAQAIFCRAPLPVRLVSPLQQVPCAGPVFDPVQCRVGDAEIAWRRCDRGRWPCGRQDPAPAVRHHQHGLPTWLAAICSGASQHPAAMLQRFAVIKDGMPCLRA